MQNYTSHDLLGLDGPFKFIIKGFSPRVSQKEMAKAIERAIKDKQALIVEAGTGTGKTFAYLTPVLLSGKKAIISTGTKNLQDQLMQKDFPILKKALKTPFQVALLKGRNNYLCIHRLEVANASGTFTSREVVSQLHKIKFWSKQTKQGDIAELTLIPEDSPIWPHVTSTKDNCLGQDCDFYKKCHLMKARQNALKADVVIVNHYLFFADIVLKDTGFGELLPSADSVVFDEAHQIPEIASQFFGTSISSRQLLELARDTKNEALEHAKDFNEILKQTELVEKTILDMRLAFGQEKQRRPWQDIVHKPAMKSNIELLIGILDELNATLEGIAQRSKGLEACWERGVELLRRLKLVTGITPDGQIHWYETFKHSFGIHLTPLNLSENFNEFMSKEEKAWIFTSATLTAANSFEFFQKRTGLNDAEQLQLPSEFNFREQTIFYVPKNMPQPSHPEYNMRVVEAAIPVIKAVRGRTFFLFTSHYALQTAAELLSSQIQYPLLVQGTLPKRKLLEEYHALGNAVLLGTNSFWEGVDVKGEALSCVIIDKLPFASPNDPILKARLDAIQKSGGNPFMEYQVSQAVISLKQGFGRLIRDANDRGVLMLCDPRLLSKQYGKVFIESLPRLNMVRDVEDVVAMVSSFD